MFWVLLFFAPPSSVLLCTLVPEVIMLVLRGAAVNQLLYPAARAPRSSDGLSVVIATVSTHPRCRYQADASLISLYQHSLKARNPPPPNLCGVELFILFRRQTATQTLLLPDPSVEFFFNLNITLTSVRATIVPHRQKSL